MRLGADNIERIECLKSWIRTGIVERVRADDLLDEGGQGNI